MRYQLIMLEEINDCDTSESALVESKSLLRLQSETRQTTSHIRATERLEIARAGPSEKTKGREVNECR